MPKVKIDELPEELQEIYKDRIMPVDTNISFDSVILSEENKAKYAAFIKEHQYAERLVSYGLYPSNRLLLYGASGTGKTFSLKALSNLLDYTMVYVDIAKSLTEGNVSKNISDIFKLSNYIAENYGGCLTFLDECDSIVWNRDQTATTESGMLRRATNTIFQCLDQMHYKNLFAAATNMLHRIDAAFERRCDIKMAFKRPDVDIDDAIKHFIYPKFYIVDDVSPTVKDIVKRRAKQNAKLSYYEIEQLVYRGMKRAVLNDTNIVHTSEIYADLQTNMHFKIRHQTGDDNPQIFENNQTYEPSDKDEVINI